MIAGGQGREEPWTAKLAAAASPRDFQRHLVRAAMASTEATSGAFFERTDRGMLRGVVVEGLFPPPRELTKAEPSTRARMVEEVFRSQEIPVGAGVIGEAALRPDGELIADATADPRVVRHEDAALGLSSLIAVPLWVGGSGIGVVALSHCG